MNPRYNEPLYNEDLVQNNERYSLARVNIQTRDRPNETENEIPFNNEHILPIACRSVTPGFQFIQHINRICSDYQ